MGVLLNLVPWYYRWLALLAAFAACLAYGEFDGYQRRAHAADIEEAKVEVLGDAARAKALEQQAKQDKTTKELTDAHQADRTRIIRYYERRLRESPGGGAMSAPSERSGGADGSAAKPRPGGACAVDPAFELKCTLDAEQVMKLQRFLTDNGFPVSRPPAP